MSSIIMEEAHIVRQQTRKLKNAAQHQHHHHHHNDSSVSDYYYPKVAFCGALSSTVRWPLSPLELIKTRMQAHPSNYPSLRQGLVQVMAKEGLTGLFGGLGPTALAYGFQTATKYCLYETFKDTAHRNVEADFAVQYSAAIYMLSAASAEAVADILMCPWEMIKVRMQTDARFPQSTSGAVREMWQHRRHYAFPFGTLGPLLARQIPATMVNFCTFEYAVQAIYSRVLVNPKDSYSKQTQLTVTTLAGFLAGAVCAAVSHPADSIVSRMAVSSNNNTSVLQIVRQTGLYNLATRGLATRMAMTGGIISMQWFVYDGVRTLMNLGTTGGGDSCHDAS
jgi:solute carrier family 25 phosphate transporter 3